MQKRGHAEAFGERKRIREPGNNRGSSEGRVDVVEKSIPRSSPDSEDGDPQGEVSKANNRKQSARGFIASQACIDCRKKKTKCDEGHPCSLCYSLGKECKYTERKPTRQEASLSTVMSSLRRVETKLDQLASDGIVARSPTIISTPAVNTHLEKSGLSEDRYVTSPFAASDNTVAATDVGDSLVAAEKKDNVGSLKRSPISFSQHKVLFWPAIAERLPQGVLEILQGPEPEYAVVLEMERLPLTMVVHPYPSTAGDSWLRNIPFSIITGLSEAYFDMFNPGSPILDSDAYFKVTLSTVIRNGFGYNAESCIVLNVLALGCVALKTYEEGDFPLASQHDMPVSNSFHPPEWVEIIREYHPGQRFFNEGRKLAGAVMCESSIQSAQFYLLSGVYYTQIIRPTDQWTMTNKACICLLTLIRRQIDINWENWKGDMMCRLFWTALMAESVLIQELDLPASGLSQLELESRVPLPKFTPFQGNQSDSKDVEDDTFFHFHFLAQVAHRIILSRIRHAIFFYSTSEPFPPAPLVSELHHQIEQWRAGLPEPIKFSAGSASPYPKTPAHAFATALLHARYYIAQFHIGRPFIYKALHDPSTLTETDLEACHRGLTAGMDWEQTTGLRRQMISGMPVPFGVCSQFFGQLLMIWALETSTDARLRRVLPEGYKAWCKKMISLLEECSQLCVTLHKDLSILRALGY